MAREVLPMRKYTTSILIAAAVSLCVILAHGQDSPSLGDVARRARQKKEQAEAAESKDPKAAKAPKVITNDDIPSHPETTDQSYTVPDHREAEAPPSSDGPKMSGEYWKGRIQAEKNQIQSLQSRIDQLNGSVHFAPGNCVRNCVEWNLHQKQKQQEAARLQSQLARAQKNLGEMQEAARRQGYGNAVYDP
jgi:hypothetical protein